MATERLQIVLDAAWRGGAAVRAANADLSKVDEAAVRSAASLGKGLAIGAGVAGAALGALAIGARATWQAIGKGAELDRSRDQFERLAESINSTGDAMLGKLKTATDGLLSDAELIAAAGQIMSLGLAKTEDAVVRLTTVSGKLGWDMNQVILTMANDSVMRLDALGLSIDTVNSKMQRLQSEGFSKGDAFDLAVIEAGEEKILLVGDAADTTAGKLKGFQTAIENAQNAFNEGLAVGVANGIDQIGAASLEAADDVAYLTGKLGELWGTYIGTAAASVAGYAKTQQILDDAIKFNLIDPELATQLTNQRAGILPDPSMFGGDRATAIRHAEGTIANLEKQVGEITGQRTALETNSWAKWAANINQATAATEAATRATEDNRAEGRRADQQRQEGAKYMQELADRGLAVANATDEGTRSMGGYASAIDQASEAMKQLSAASGSYFDQARKMEDFNPAEFFYQQAMAAGASAAQLAQVLSATGLESPERIAEILARAQQMEAIRNLAGGVAAGGDVNMLWAGVQASSDPNVAANMIAAPQNYNTAVNTNITINGPVGSDQILELIDQYFRTKVTTGPSG